MADPPRPPSRDFDWWLDVAPAAAIGLILLWALLRKAPGRPAAEYDVDTPPLADAGRPRAAPYVSALERDLAERQGPAPTGVVPEPLGPPDGGLRRVAGVSQTLRPRGSHALDPMIKEELARLVPITKRYYAREPAVRAVDRAFGRLPRYMAVRRRYIEDHDAYAFIHDSLALPEVRRTIHRYALDPQVWRVTLGMVREGLKARPPKPLYDEMKRFFTHDSETVAFAVEMSTSVMPYAPALLAQALKPGDDLGALKALAKDLFVGKAGFAPPPGLALTAGPPAPAPAQDAGPTPEGVPPLPPQELKIGDTDAQRRRQLDDLGKGSRPD